MNTPNSRPRARNDRRQRITIDHRTIDIPENQEEIDTLVETFSQGQLLECIRECMFTSEIPPPPSSASDK